MKRARLHRSLSARIAVIAVLLAAGSALAQPPRPEKAALSLTADCTAYEPGGTARIAAKVTVEDGWHVNSNTPTFDYLIPTKLDLELPSGWPDEAVRYLLTTRSDAFTAYIQVQGWRDAEDSRECWKPGLYRTKGASGRTTKITA